MDAHPPIHQSDPDQAPDDAFEPGALHHLVVGNTGRMLDTRRTPVTVRSVDPARGVFEVEVLAFEDTGARWIIEAERVSRFQFSRGAARADGAVVADLVAAIERYDRPLHIQVDARARARTERRLRDEERRAATVLGGVPPVALGGRAGDAALQHAWRAHLAPRGLDALETGFSEQFVSNPSSGDLVKGHEMVVARLGLVAYHGKVARDPDVFAGEWTEARRAEHIVLRLAFVRAMLRAAGHERVWLYRGLASDVPLRSPAPRTFVSSTFDRAVAESVAGRGRATVVTALHGQLVPVERIFMTYLETAALDSLYLEAEAILLADRRNRAF